MALYDRAHDLPYCDCPFKELVATNWSDRSILPLRRDGGTSKSRSPKRKDFGGRVD
jgi:hypothetical protein